MIDAEAAQRFRADLETLTRGPPDALGLAVSGGPDSLALLLLAAAAFPGRVHAASVDHGLRPEGAAEAEHVAATCAGLGVPHAILPIRWPVPPVSNLPAQAREKRYAALSRWAGDNRLQWVATAHHLDDQAETVLMRLARGAGLPGLAGVQPVGRFVQDAPPVGYVRPLLGWRKAELADLVDQAGLTAVDDPTNHSDQLDRTHVRRLLVQAPLLHPPRLARSAANLADAEEALAWTTEQLYRSGHQEAGDAVTLTVAADLPTELRRRLLLKGLRNFTATNSLPGPKVMRLLGALSRGRPGTLAGVKVSPGPPWRFERSPPHRG